MSSADLTLVRRWAGAACGRGTVVLGHVDLQLFGVGAGGRLPAAALLGGVEVVGQVFGLRVAHFPIGGETGFLEDGSSMLVDVTLGATY